MPCGPCGPLPPVAPTGPVSPVAPAGPVSPVTPAGPVSPVAPAGPVSPVGPAGPVSPVSPLGPAGPWGPIGPIPPDPSQETAISFFLQSSSSSTARILPLLTFTHTWVIDSRSSFSFFAELASADPSVTVARIATIPTIMDSRSANTKFTLRNTRSLQKHNFGRSSNG
jgi:hypothetical protein